MLDVRLDHDILTGLPAQLFFWNSKAEIIIELLSVSMLRQRYGKYLELDLRLRCDVALCPGQMATPALMARVREQENLWWSTGKGDPIDARESGSMDPEDDMDWKAIMQESGLEQVNPTDLLVALDDFADGAIDFGYSQAFLQSMATTLSMLQQCLKARQDESYCIIVDVGDLKIQGFY